MLLSPESDAPLSAERCQVLPPCGKAHRLECGVRAPWAVSPPPPTHQPRVQVYEDAKSLRYGHLMIMTDQDHDGSHIKGLIMNFLHTFYPSLLKLPGFLLEFITPIVKVCGAGRAAAVGWLCGGVGGGRGG